MTASAAIKKDQIIYDAYWGIWVRVLSRLGKDFPQVELVLTASNNGDAAWKVVADGKIRMRTADFKEGMDRRVDQLPESVLMGMTERLGIEKTRYFCYYDILPMLDIDKLKREHAKTAEGGYISLGKVLKERGSIEFTLITIPGHFLDAAGRPKANYATELVKVRADKYTDACENYFKLTDAGHIVGLHEAEVVKK